MRPDYKEQIKSPKWQKRRLEILQRDSFTCQICGATDKTLHVHHLRYIRGKDMWDYEDQELISLCEDCHNEEHNIDDCSYDIYEMIDVIRHRGVTNFEIRLILDMVISDNDDSLFKIIAEQKYYKDDGTSEKLIRLSNRRNSIRQNLSNKLPPNEI